jgi:hypothetical protein
MATVAHKPRVITHEHIIALREFDERGLFPDRTVQDLFLRIGDKSTSWLYKKWQRTKGRRKSVERTLGHWAAMQPPAAREANHDLNRSWHHLRRELLASRRTRKAAEALAS